MRNAEARQTGNPAWDPSRMVGPHELEFWSIVYHAPAHEGSAPRHRASRRWPRLVWIGWPARAGTASTTKMVAEGL